MEILNQTLRQMPKYFSSNEFSDVAKRKGLTKRQIASGVIASYLHINAIQGATRRSWRKMDVEKINIGSNKEDEIDLAINLLKSNGYKITKKVEQWIEI
jgi:peptidyl-tRNA hydrolase